MTSPAPTPPPAPARFRPAPTQGRRVLAVVTSAAVVAVAALVVALFSFFVGNGQDPRILEQLFPHFALVALITWLLLAVANSLGATRAWFLALITGLTSSCLAALIATTVTAAGAGNPLSAQLYLFVVGSLVSLNLVFILAATAGEVFLAPKVQRGILRYAPNRPPRRMALVRIPASNLAEGELTFKDRLPVDAQLADEQWDNYCAALVAEGWETLEVDAAPDLADSVFVEDAIVLFGDLAVLTNPGAESRRAEIASVERTVRAIPGLTVRRIESPGTLDGGDVLKVDSTVYVGASSRTNAEGIRQLRALLTPHGYSVVAVPVTKALHLKSTMTALPDGTIIGDPDLVDVPSLFPSFLPVPEPEGVAVVELSPESLLMSSSAPETAAMLADLGYRVVTVDIGEFEKLEGGVTCLSVRVR